MANSTDMKARFFTDVYPDLATVLIEYDGKRILVDPGLNQLKYSFDKMLARYDIPNLDAVVITHYHGDHSNLTKRILARNQFKGRIICHKATAEIVQSYFDIQKVPDQFATLEFGEAYNLFDNISVTLYNAGHVLGSGIAYFRLGGKVIMITGDLGSRNLPIVCEPHKKFPPASIDLLVLDAKQAGRDCEAKMNGVSLGDLIYYKLKDCLMFDDGNILIYAPVLQIPMLLYCLNYIFNKKKYMDVSREIAKVYLDAYPMLTQLLNIFYAYQELFDKDEPESVAGDDQPFNFKRLNMFLPRERELQRSIVITSNKRQFIRLFNQFKRSDKNDVLLLNNNIYHALDGNYNLIDKDCSVQIKRLPCLHFHPDLPELIEWCHEINKGTDVKRIIFYHYKNPDTMTKILTRFRNEVNPVTECAHQLNDNQIVI